MVLLEEIKRLGDNGKVLLGELLAEVPALSPRNSCLGMTGSRHFAHHRWMISKLASNHFAVLQARSQIFTFVTVFLGVWGEKKRNKKNVGYFQEKHRMPTLPRCLAKKKKKNFFKYSIGFFSSALICMNEERKSTFWANGRLEPINFLSGH